MKDTNVLKTILSHHVTGVLNFVEKELQKDGQELPKEGMLTGQAVCDLFLKLSGWKKFREEKEFKLNDIDVFNIMTEEAYLKHSREVGSCINTKQQSLNKFIGVGYGGFVGTINSESYIIVKTKTEKRLNITHVSFYLCKTSPIYENILSKFDINCTQIGIDLKTGELIVSNHFLKFYQTGQLEIAYPGTPYHSPIRFVRKMEEHGFYGNVKGEMTKIIFVLHRFRDFRHYFSDKQEKTFDKYEHILGEYFEKVTHIDREISNLEEVYSEEGTLTMVLDKTKEKFGVFTLKVKTPELIYPLVDICKDIGYPETYDGVLKLYNFCFYKSNTFKSNLIKNIGDEYKRLIRLRESSGKDTMVNFLVNFYGDNDFSLASFKKVRKMCIKHDAVSYAFIGIETFTDIVNQYEKILALVKVHGEMAYGLYEQYDFRREVERGEEEGKTQFEVAQAYIDENSGELTEQSFETYEDEEWEIKELLSSADLIMESSRRRHCVSGYARLVKVGTSKIISFENKIDQKLSFTMELRDGASEVYKRKFMTMFTPNSQFAIETDYRETTEEFNEFNPDMEPMRYYRNVQSRGFENMNAPHADNILTKVKVLPLANVCIAGVDEETEIRSILRRAETEILGLDNLLSNSNGEVQF